MMSRGENLGNNIAPFLRAIDEFLFNNVEEVTYSQLETFIMACWRCFMVNAEWLASFWNDETTPFWQIASTSRLLLETIADMKYVLQHKNIASIALNEYHNIQSLTGDEFLQELSKKIDHKKSLLDNNIGGGGNVKRIKKMLGIECVNAYAILCNFTHCSYSGIAISSQPSSQQTTLRESAICIALKLCNEVVPILAEYEKFSELSKIVGEHNV